jgi:aspartate kinase
MAIVVYKFGGTSIDTPEKRDRIIEITKKSLAQGDRVVIVVSAMGRKGQPYATDTLLSLLPSGTDAAPAVVDLISSCGECISACVLADVFKQAGVSAHPMTALQAGIKTDGRFGGAKILGIDKNAILEKLEDQQIVIITGFQGYSLNNELTTLGRGGSDTTAIALAGYLKAERTVIYTDVFGVAQTDPRIIPEVVYLRAIDFESMLYLAEHGAKVIHPNAVRTAMELGVPFEIKDVMSDEGGTLVGVKGEAPGGLIGAVVSRNDGTVFNEWSAEESPGSIYVDYEKADMLAVVCDGSERCTPAKINRFLKECEFSSLRYYEKGRKGVWLLPESHGKKALQALFARLYEKVGEDETVYRPSQPETT